MKHQKSCGPRLGKLVHQLLGVVTFAYDLLSRSIIAHWKGIVEEIHFRCNDEGNCINCKPIFPKKHHLGTQNSPKVKTAKNTKLPKLLENCFESARKVGWPPISTWINHILCRSYLRKQFHNMLIPLSNYTLLYEVGSIIIRHFDPDFMRRTK
jgi:hypothetical protein